MSELIELREIRVFLTLAEELHFGRTAERLGLTQSRVSQSLRTLESKLGNQLVHRTSRHVALTLPGERFRGEVGPAFADLTTVLERAAAHHLEGTVRVGVMYPSSGGEQLVTIIDAFEARYPGCDVQVGETPQDDPGRPLRRGEIDLLATPLLGEPEGFVLSVTLGFEPRVLAMSRDHPLAERTQIMLEDLGDYEVASPRILPDELQEAWIPLHTPSGRPIRRLRQRINSDDGIAMLVARGKVVHPAVPSTVAYFGHPNIVGIPVADLPPAKVVLLGRPEAGNPRLRAFLRVAHDVLGD